jgi:hypothetical protein
VTEEPIPSRTGKTVASNNSEEKFFQAKILPIRRMTPTTTHRVIASRIIQSIFLKISRATWGENAIRHPPYPVRKPLGLCVHVKGHTVVDPKGRIQEMMRLMGLENSGR